MKARHKRARRAARLARHWLKEVIKREIHGQRQSLRRSMDLAMYRPAPCGPMTVIRVGRGGCQVWAKGGEGITSDPGGPCAQGPTLTIASVDRGAGVITWAKGGEHG